MHRFNFNLCKSAARLGVLHGTRGEPAHPARPGRSGPAPPRAPPERGPAAAAGPAPGAGDKRRFPFLPLPPASPGRVRPEKPPPLPRVWRHWPPPRCARPPQLPAEGRGPGCAGAARERAVPCRAAPGPQRWRPAGGGGRTALHRRALPSPSRWRQRHVSGRSRAPGGRPQVCGGSPGRGAAGLGGGRGGAAGLCFRPGKRVRGCPPCPRPARGRPARLRGLRPPGCGRLLPASRRGVPAPAPGPRGRVSSGGAPRLGQDSVALLVIGVLNKIGCFRTAHFSVRLLWVPVCVCVRACACLCSAQRYKRALKPKHS